VSDTDITTGEAVMTSTTRTTVVHVRKAPHYDLYIYIGRPSVWGNLYRVGVDGDRETCIKMYAAWVQTRPDLLARLPELRGKVLGCYCKPAACHGDVLAELADA
jgi:hypothetical protein